MYTLIAKFYFEHLTILVLVLFIKLFPLTIYHHKEYEVN
jgi:hypothetical protein